MRPEHVLSALTRLLNIASYMDKNRKIGLLCNLRTIQSLILAEVEYNPIDYCNCEINGKHVFTAQYMPNYAIGVAYFETSQSLTRSLPNWSLAKHSHIQTLDDKLSIPGYHFIDKVLYIAVKDTQICNTKSWPSQMAFIENS